MTEFSSVLTNNIILIFFTRYVEGDFRFRSAHFGSQRNAFKLCKVWAEKEFKNLLRLHSSNVRCPTPLRVRSHILAMQFIGDDGLPAPQVSVYYLFHYRL